MDLPRHLEDRLEEHPSRLMNHDRYLKTAVLIPLIRRPEETWRLLFERRADHLDHQPGDVCFPGGRVEDEDDSLRETAVRETSEEFRIDPDDVDVLGSLDYLATPWRMMIFPFVGTLRGTVEVRPDPSEVDSIFEVPLERARSVEPTAHHVELEPRPPDDFPYDKIPGGRDYGWQPGILPELFYEFDGRVVWGLTGRILDHFLRILEEGETGRSDLDEAP